MIRTLVSATAALLFALAQHAASARALPVVTGSPRDFAGASNCKRIDAVLLRLTIETRAPADASDAWHRISLVQPCIVEGTDSVFNVRFRPEENVAELHLLAHRMGSATEWKFVISRNDRLGDSPVAAPVTQEIKAKKGDLVSTVLEGKGGEIRVSFSF